MAELIGVCQIRTRLGWRKRWPCYGRVGHWVLCPCAGHGKTPVVSETMLSVTHEPTGYRAKDVAIDDKQAMRILRKYAELFGGAKTVKGIMRKYKKLTERQKDFARGMRKLP